MYTRFRYRLARNGLLRKRLRYWLLAGHNRGWGLGYWLGSSYRLIHRLRYGLR